MAKVASSKQRIIPLGDKVLIRRIAPEETTKGGIVLPDTAKEKPREGIVHAVGSGRVLENGKTAPLQVKKRDRVLLSSYGGTEVNLDGEEYILMSEENILAILTS